MLAAVVFVRDHYMRTEVIDAASPGAKERALAVLRSGGLIALPTDTVYGLAADPWDDDAVRRLYTVKERPERLPIPLLLSDANEIDRVAVLAAPCSGLLERFWPGALTLVLERKAAVCDAVSSRPTVAVRVPDLRLTRDVIEGAGGVLAVTSANLSGGPNPVTAHEVEEQLGGRIPLILDGGPCPERIPSTIVDCSVFPPRLLRRGAIGEEALVAVVGSIQER